MARVPSTLSRDGIHPGVSRLLNTHLQEHSHQRRVFKRFPTRPRPLPIRIGTRGRHGSSSLAHHCEPATRRKRRRDPRHPRPLQLHFSTTLHRDRRRVLDRSADQHHYHAHEWPHAAQGSDASRAGSGVFGCATGHWPAACGSLSKHGGPLSRM